MFKTEISCKKIAMLFLVSCIFSFLFYAILKKTPYLHGVDSYYHGKLIEKIKSEGIHSPFTWAQFSTFQSNYADKDFLFHFILTPFFDEDHDFHEQVKKGVFLINCTFLFVLLLIISRTQSVFVGVVLLIFLILSPPFSISLLHLRPQTFAHILLLIALDSMIYNKKYRIFIVSLLYPLSHISFYVLVPFVFIIEMIRFFMKKEMHVTNVLVVISGIVIGLIIHPHFPNNLYSFYYNGILVPYETFFGDLKHYAQEFFPLTTKDMFLSNIYMMMSLYCLFVLNCFRSLKMSFMSFVWFMIFSCFLMLSFFGKRYFCHANMIYILFVTSYIKDQIEFSKNGEIKVKKKLLWILMISSLIVLPLSFNRLKLEFMYFKSTNKDYEEIAHVLKKEVPKGLTIYHSTFSDSPRFIAINPKNNYLNVLDPIYMIKYSKDLFQKYTRLNQGQFNNPHEVIKNEFQLNYGFVRFDQKLYWQVLTMKNHFEVIYKNKLGLVFRVK